MKSIYRFDIFTTHYNPCGDRTWLVERKSYRLLGWVLKFISQNAGADIWVRQSVPNSQGYPYQMRWVKYDQYGRILEVNSNMEMVARFAILDGVFTLDGGK